MDLQPKVSRQKLIENSRQKFYDNLNEHIKTNKDAKPIEEKKTATLPKRQTKTATSVTRTAKAQNDGGENSNTSNNLKKERPQSNAKPKPPLNKDIKAVTVTKEQKKEPSANLKTAPQFSKKPPQASSANFMSSSSVLSQSNVQNMTQQSKKTYSLRDQIYDQVKENIRNPKKLQEIQQQYTNVKVDFQQLIHKAKLDVMKDNKDKIKVSTVEDEISKLIDNSRKLLQRLQNISIPPPYATSILQSAIHNKTRILEAHLSTMSEDQRKFQVNDIDEYGRSAAFYAAFYGSVESLELLSSTDAKFNLTDKFHRTILHYAAMNDSSKVIEACFLGFKQQGQAMIVYGQKEEDGRSPTKHIPPAAFSPFKGRFDDDDKQRQEEERRKKLREQAMREAEEVHAVDNDDDERFEIEDDNQVNEEFKVEEEVTQGEKVFTGLAGFFTKKAVLDVEDEKKGTMYVEMEKIDKLYIPASATLKKKEEDEETIGVPQVSLNQILNYRDHKGRSALHIAVAFNNKTAVETLLFLNANPMIEDIYGQRPIEFALDDGIRDLLQNKMLRAQPPTLIPVPRVKGKKVDGTLTIKPRKMSQVSQISTTSQATKKKAQEQQQYPLDLKNLQIMINEKIMIAKIGIENDNYLQYAIKNKALDACIYLFSQVGGFDQLYKNSVGNTVLHLAIRTGSYKFVKLLFVKEIEEGCLDKPTPDDIRGNINNSSLKLLNQINNKGYTPLLAAVDQGNYEIFRFILEIYYYNEAISNQNQKILGKIINLRCDRGETALLKASRLNSVEMLYSLMQLGNEIITYEVLTTVDTTKKNILHYAVINKDRELIKRLAKLDADKMELRLQGDTKNKTPANYDQSGSFTELLNTIWDYSKEGNLRKLKLSIDSGSFDVNEQTPWLKNTALHIAVRTQQMEVIKCLVFDYNADVTIENQLGKTVIQMATAIKDEATKTTMLGLLNRLHTSTKIVRNLEAKKDKEAQKQKNIQELTRLRQQMREKIEERGLDLAQMFQMFDKNGDGVFNQLEFECAFTALDIMISKADLRRFISLSDTNKDGKVDFNEFHNMLYKEPVNEDIDRIAGESEVDFEASFEQIN